MSTSLTVETTLADLVTADPRRARILETFGLDYCCNGQRSLADAAAAADLEAAKVLAALDLPDAQAHTTPLPAENAALAHDIVDTHHAYLWEEMPRLQALVDKVFRVHGERHPELAKVRETYIAVVADLDPHMTREERRVFPAISGLERGKPIDLNALADDLKTLRTEHDALGALLVELRRHADNFEVPSDACPSYQAMLTGLKDMELDIHEHIHRENNILFPRVEGFLAEK